MGAGQEVARGLLEKYPKSRLQYAEIAAQANVNLMENLFDQGEVDAAWESMKSLENHHLPH